MSYTRVIIAGAGLAGLAAAIELSAAGMTVELAEAAPRAGGRCRSYYDRQLGATIDNGNHFVFSGNQAVNRYLARLAGHGGAARLEGPDRADYAFHDLADGSRWTLRINDSRVPFWVFDRNCRAPGTGVMEHFALAWLALAGLGAGAGTIGDSIGARGVFWRRVVEPMMLAVLNCPPEQGSARLAGHFLLESFARGGRACRTMVASPTLEAVFVEPALRWLAEHGVVPRFGRRLRGMRFAGGNVAGLDFGEGEEVVPADTAVILAVPPWVAGELVPGLAVPDRFCAIVNAHFAVPPPAGAPFITALLGGTAQWVVAHRDRVSVTISGADALIDAPREEVAAAIWRDVRATLGLNDTAMPAWQIVKEKRATFAATPEQDALRPGPRTGWNNLFLAGDWVQTDLPATIEGALRSGDRAACLAFGRRPHYGPGR